MSETGYDTGYDYTYGRGDRHTRAPWPPLPMRIHVLTNWLGNRLDQAHETGAMDLDAADRGRLQELFEISQSFLRLTAQVVARQEKETE